MDNNSWTIPANKALAYNSSIEYSVLEIEDLEYFKDKKVVVAKNLIGSIIKQCDIKNYKEIKTFKGSEFKGTICSHPFIKMDFNFEVPMLDAQFVRSRNDSSLCSSHGLMICLMFKK